MMEWNNLDVEWSNSASCNIFKKVILKFITPEPNKDFNVDSSKGLKLFTRIRLGLSYLADHKLLTFFCLAVLITIVQDKPYLKKIKLIQLS